MAVQNEDLKENVKKLEKEVNLLKIQLEENSIVMEEKMQKETLALQEKIQKKDELISKQKKELNQLQQAKINSDSSK